MYFGNTLTPTASYSNYLSKTLPDFSFDGSIDYEIELDIKMSGGGGGFSFAPTSDVTYKKHIALGYNTTQICAYWGNETASDESVKRQSYNLVGNQWYHWKITKNGNDFTWNMDNGFFTHSVTASWLGTYGQMGLCFYRWESISITVRNIKIKSL